MKLVEDCCFLISMQNDRTYRKSNAVTTTNFYATKNARLIALRLLKEEDATRREEIGQLLLNELSEFFLIAAPQLTVQDKRQYHTKRDGKLFQKTFGTYNSGNIRITNRTAIREKVVAAKTFLDTLIHEFMHHYDFNILKLSRSLHTAGFFSRLNEIKEKISP